MSPYKEEKLRPKITVLPFTFTEKNKIFQNLKAKDLANLSDKNYISQRKFLKSIHQMPEISKVNMLKYEHNNFFEIENNDLNKK